MRYLSIKTFAKYQHYKDRRPPWIKLHVEVLDDYAFTCLQDASKAHLMLLWVLASKMDNHIPYDLPFLARKLGTTSPIDVEELVLQGFIEVSQDDGSTLAPRKQSAMPETEGEGEAESEAEGARVKFGTRRAAKASKAGPAWLRPLTARWKLAVGKAKEASIERELGESVSQFGIDRVGAAVDVYAKTKRAQGKPMKLQWFAEDIVTWVLRGDEANQPLVDEHGGLTEYGERITRPDKVPA